MNQVKTAVGGADAIIASRASKEAKDAVAILAGSISVISEGDDFLEIVAINPAQLIDGVETVGGFEIEFVEIITPEN